MKTIKLNYKIEFGRFVMGTENDYYTDDFEEFVCNECKKTVKKGDVGFTPHRTNDENDDYGFYDDWVICEKCADKRK